VTVEVLDQYDNLVNSTASITIAFGSNPTGAALGGTIAASAVSGIAKFSDLTVSKAGIAYTLAATSSGLAAAPRSDSFNVAARLITVTATASTKTYDGTTVALAVPAITSGSLAEGDTANFIEAYSTRNGSSGLTLTPSGTVDDGNDGNNYMYTFVPVSTGVITRAALTITAMTNTKVYDGTTSAAAIPIVSGLKGTDQVTNLSETYDTPAVGTGKTLSVASYAVSDGNGGNNYMVATVANHSGVIIQTPTQLVIHTQPSASATAGQVFPTQPVIYVEDQNGNLVTGDYTTEVTVSLRVGTGPLLGTTTVTVSGGIATFANLKDNRAETIILLFTAPTLVKAQSNPIKVKLAPGGAGESADAEVRGAHPAKTRRVKLKTVLVGSSHPRRATAGRVRARGQADTARDRVFGSSRATYMFT
jgi:hypothetical protein